MLCYLIDAHQRSGAYHQLNPPGSLSWFCGMESGNETGPVLGGRRRLQLQYDSHMTARVFQCADARGSTQHA